VVATCSECAVAGRESFSCSFEDDDSCLLVYDNTNSTEMWMIDNGRGLVKDNSLNSGLYCLYAILLSICTQSLTLTTLLLDWFHAVQL